MLKKIDKLLLSSFLGPFMVSFAIALFVLIMQFLWLYIDDIAGKGVNLLTMFELIGYLSISTFPMALPIAVLIASVMVMGNLAERYELSSMKSAGVSLLRVMRSLIAAAAVIGLFSYVCSDFIIPVSNLKFKTRLYDIRKAKPTLTLEEGVFNEDFRNFLIRIGDKKSDGETIGNVLIEDQTTAGRLRFNQILADSGQMFTTPNKRFFVMELYNGVQYQEPGTSGDRPQQKYPFVRTHFGTMTKVWDLKEFELNRTDEENFKNQRSMLSMAQLRVNVDSLSKVLAITRKALADDLLLQLKKVPVKPQPVEQPKDVADNEATRRAREFQVSVNKPQLPQQQLGKPLNEYGSLLETFPEKDKVSLQREAVNHARIAKTTVETRKSQHDQRKKDRVKTAYELYTKYSFALVCLILLFIGAPMGAIIRKGGFGYPILVSIIFFVTFIFLTILCRKFAELYWLTPFWAAMLPCIILVPVGITLTLRAMNDSQMFNTGGLDRISNWIRKRLAAGRKEKTALV